MAVIIMIKRRLVGATLQRIYLAVLSVFVKTKPLPLSSDGPRVPLSTAIAVAAVIAATEHLLGVTMPWSAWTAMPG